MICNSETLAICPAYAVLTIHSRFLDWQALNGLLCCFREKIESNPVYQEAQQKRFAVIQTVLDEAKASKAEVKRFLMYLGLHASQRHQDSQQRTLSEPGFAYFALQVQAQRSMAKLSAMEVTADADGGRAEQAADAGTSGRAGKAAEDMMDLDQDSSR